jgi:D-tyrosyl-tRNA(Tyr) deacylase
MRAVLQRVKNASVEVEGKSVGCIGNGLLVLFGVHKDDKPEETLWMVQKIVNLRIFSDAEGKMNLSVKDVCGEILVVSQFTLYGNCTNGRRPDFFSAAAGHRAEEIYRKFTNEIEHELGRVQTGLFGAQMAVSLVNDGPITLIVDNKFNA